MNPTCFPNNPIHLCPLTPKLAVLIPQQIQLLQKNEIRIQLFSWWFFKNNYGTLNRLNITTHLPGLWQFIATIVKKKTSPLKNKIPTVS